MTASRILASNAQNHTPAVPLGQLASLFEAIAAKASEIDRLCYFGVDGEDQLQLTLDFVRAAVRQVGWLADLGSTKLGGHGNGPLRNSPEDWLLPPTYRALSAHLGTTQ
jgi:hypothetical protein